MVAEKVAPQVTVTAGKDNVQSSMVFNVHENHTHSTWGHLSRFEIIKGNVPGQPTVVGFEGAIKIRNDPPDCPIRNSKGSS